MVWSWCFEWSSLIWVRWGDLQTGTFAGIEAKNLLIGLDPAVFFPGILILYVISRNSICLSFALTSTHLIHSFCLSSLHIQQVSLWSLFLIFACTAFSELRRNGLIYASDECWLSFSAFISLSKFLMYQNWANISVYINPCIFKSVELAIEFSLRVIWYSYLW